MAITQRNQKAGQKMKLIHGNLSKRQLGIFGLPRLFKDEAETETKTTSKQKTSGTKTVASSLVSDSQETGKASTSLLSGEVQGAIEKLVLDLTNAQQQGGGNAGDINEIGGLLLERATGAADDINALTDSIIADERRKGQKELDAISTSIGQDAGGVGVGSNSFVAGATAEGQAALTTGLARLSSELSINARGIASTEFGQAAEVLGAGSTAGATEVNTLAQLLAQLKGATSVTDTTNVQSQTQEQDITEIVSQLVTGEGTQIGTSVESPSLFTLATNLLAAGLGGNPKPTDNPDDIVT